MVFVVLSATPLCGGWVMRMLIVVMKCFEVKVAVAVGRKFALLKMM